MEIRILELIEGAKKAEGLTVIIDVFRAFPWSAICMPGERLPYSRPEAWRRPGI